MRPRYEFSNILAAPSASEIDELADKSESLEQRVASLNDSYETLRKREVELTEWRWVLTEAGGFFDRVSRGIKSPFKALAEADRLSRLLGTWMRLDNRLKMTKLRYYKMLNSKQEVKMETFPDNSRFPLETLDLLLESYREDVLQLSNEFCGEHYEEICT